MITDEEDFGAPMSESEMAASITPMSGVSATNSDFDRLQQLATESVNGLINMCNKLAEQVKELKSESELIKNVVEKGFSEIQENMQEQRGELESATAQYGEQVERKMARIVEEAAKMTSAMESSRKRICQIEQNMELRDKEEKERREQKNQRYREQKEGEQQQGPSEQQDSRHRSSSEQSESRDPAQDSPRKNQPKNRHSPDEWSRSDSEGTSMRQRRRGPDGAGRAHYGRPTRPFVETPQHPSRQRRRERMESSDDESGWQSIDSSDSDPESSAFGDGEPITKSDGPELPRTAPPKRFRLDDSDHSWRSSSSDGERRARRSTNRPGKPTIEPPKMPFNLTYSVRSLEQIHETKEAMLNFAANIWQQRGEKVMANIYQLAEVWLSRELKSRAKIDVRSAADYIKRRFTEREVDFATLLLSNLKHDRSTFWARAAEESVGYSAAVRLTHNVYLQMRAVITLREEDGIQLGSEIKQGPWVGDDMRKTYLALRKWCDAIMPFVTTKKYTSWSGTNVRLGLRKAKDKLVEKLCGAEQINLTTEWEKTASRSHPDKAELRLLRDLCGEAALDAAESHRTGKAGGQWKQKQTATGWKDTSGPGTQWKTQDKTGTQWSQKSQEKSFGKEKSQGKSDKDRGVCRYWSQGGCFKGSACTFSHSRREHANWTQHRGTRMSNTDRWVYDTGATIGVAPPGHPYLTLVTTDMASIEVAGRMIKAPYAWASSPFGQVRVAVVENGPLIMSARDECRAGGTFTWPAGVGQPEIVMSSGQRYPCVQREGLWEIRAPNREDVGLHSRARDGSRPRHAYKVNMAKLLLEETDVGRIVVDRYLWNRRRTIYKNAEPLRNKDMLFLEPLKVSQGRSSQVLDPS